MQISYDTERMMVAIDTDIRKNFNLEGKLELGGHFIFDEWDLFSANCGKNKICLVLLVKRLFIASNEVPSLSVTIIKFPLFLTVYN